VIPIRIALPLAAALILGMAPSALAASTSTRVAPGTLAPSDVYTGCCTDPDVVNYGYHIDFNAWPDGDELTDQLRSVGLLFGRGIHMSHPPTIFLTDASRGSECQRVLNGEPPFSGWEYMIFVDPVNNRWSKVQRVGASVGFSDQSPISFLAAYDMNGNLLDFKYNDRIGFQFLSIERPTADISRVLVGDCDGPYCYQDGGGSALNCLTFSGPVATATPLPATITMPNPPRLQGVPGVGGPGVIVLTLLLGGIGVMAVSRGLRRQGWSR
jgi:hypothetical protein